jgi:hypothetical protein
VKKGINEPPRDKPTSPVVSLAAPCFNGGSFDRKFIIRGLWADLCGGEAEGGRRDKGWGQYGAAMAYGGGAVAEPETAESGGPYPTTR